MTSINTFKEEYPLDLHSTPNEIMRKGTKISLLLLLLLPVTGFSQFRKYTNEFLNIGAGARELAKSSAQVGSANDATAGY